MNNTRPSEDRSRQKEPTRRTYLLGLWATNGLGSHRRPCQIPSLSPKLNDLPSQTGPVLATHSHFVPSKSLQTPLGSPTTKHKGHMPRAPCLFLMPTKAVVTPQCGKETPRNCPKMAQNLRGLAAKRVRHKSVNFFWCRSCALSFVVSLVEKQT